MKKDKDGLVYVVHSRCNKHTYYVVKEWEQVAPMIERVRQADKACYPFKALFLKPHSSHAWQE